MSKWTKPLLAALSISLMAAGCAAGTVRDQVSMGTAPAPRGFGKTVLICQVALPAGSVATPDKIKTVTERVERTLAELPGVELLPAPGADGPFGPQPAGRSDAELAQAALAAGADTVALVQVLDYGGRLTLSLLPPYWKTTLEYGYHARVVDAHTGALYLDANRGRTRDGLFSARGKAALERDFADDLAALLRGHPRPEAGQDRAAS